jgi:hypothetical protein
MGHSVISQVWTLWLKADSSWAADGVKKESRFDPSLAQTFCFPLTVAEPVRLGMRPCLDYNRLSTSYNTSGSPKSNCPIGLVGRRCPSMHDACSCI